MSRSNITLKLVLQYIIKYFHRYVYFIEMIYLTHTELSQMTTVLKENRLGLI